MDGLGARRRDRGDGPIGAAPARKGIRVGDSVCFPRSAARWIDLPDGVCFEIKWLDADEFSHWSPIDFGRSRGRPANGTRWMSSPGWFAVTGRRV